MGLLRESSKAVGQDVNLEATVGGEGASDVEHGEALVAFGEAVTRGSGDLDRARDALRTAVGDEAFVLACGIAGIFNGLVRTADLSGIPLDEGTLHASADFREPLGLNRYGGSANTEIERGDPAKAPERFLGVPS